MKKHIILFSLLVTLFTTMFPTTALAQQPGGQNGIINWLKDGDFNAFLYGDVDSITFSKVDLDGKKHSNVVVQEVWTRDSVYRIPIANIDSVAFKAPETILKDGIFHITEWHYNYVTETTESSVTFDASIPADSLPSVDQVVVSDLAFVKYFEKGFAGRVVRIVRSDDKVRIECEEVSFEDIYDQLFSFGKSVGYNGGDSPSRTPQRIHLDDSDILTFDLDDIWPLEPIKIIDDESGHVNLNVHPSISLDYAICYNVKGKENKFKCILSPTLNCDFDVNWHKDINLLSIKKPFVEINIPTKIPLLFAQFNVNGFLDLSGNVDLSATFPFTVRSNIGYDSQNGFIRNFNGTGIQTPQGSVELDATVYAGLSLEFEAFFIDDDLDWADASIELKAGPQVTGKIRFESDTNYGLDCYNNFMNSCITLEPLVAQLSARVNTVFFDEPKTWSSGQWSVFGQKDYYLFPKFTAPYLPSLNESNISLTALTTDVSRNLIFPVYPGIELYKNGSLMTSKYSTKSYQQNGDLDHADLQLELMNYAVGDYTAKPIFKLFNSTIKASPSSSVTIPDTLYVPNSVTVKKGETKTIEFTGGWGEYNLTNSTSSVCAAYVTGSLIKITGIKDGSAQLTLKDKRSSETKTIAVTVSDATLPPSIMADPDSINFGTVVKGYTATKTFTVTGSNLTGNITLASSNHVFTVSPATITPLYGSVNQTVTVTYNPDEVGNNGGYININGNGFERIRVSLKGKGEEPYINVNPTDLNFGTSLLPGKIYTKSFTVTTNVPGALSSSYSETESGVFTVPSTIKAGSNTVKFMSSDYGSYSGVIHINDPKSGASARVMMEAKVAAVVTAAPDSINFGTIVKGYTATKTFTVTGSNLTGDITLSSSNHVFKINKTTLTPSNGTVNTTVTVTYDPDEAANNGGYINIIGDGFERVRVSLKGKCEDPYINVSPSTLSFGDNLIPGKSYSKTLTVTTNVPGALSSSYSETVSGAFTVPSVTGAGSYTVKFKSDDAGSYSGVIHINDAKSGASASVTMTGKVSAIIGADPSSWDFGTVVKGYTSAKAFTITGSGLHSNMEVSSSNSNFKVSRTSLASSGGSLTVTYQPTTTGSHSGTITISGNGTTKTISVSGKCEAGYINVSPSTLSFGDNLIPGKSYSKTLTVTTNVPGALSSSYSETVSGAFTVPSVTGAGSYTVKFKSDDAGSYSGVIHINDAKSGASASVTMTGKVSAIIGADPSSWDFGTVVKGYTSAKAFTITGSGLHSNMEVSSSNSNFKVSRTSLASSGGSLTVTYQPTTTGSHSGTITISGNGTTKTISVSGKCEAGYINVSPSTLSFGDNLLPGKSYSKMFTVTTNVPGALSSSYSETVSGVFTVPSVTGAGSYTARFKSDDLGSYSGVIRINDPKSGASASVTMTARNAISPL